jgi:hypothetical protein
LQKRESVFVAFAAHDFDLAVDVFHLVAEFSQPHSGAVKQPNDEFVFGVLMLCNK